MLDKKSGKTVNSFSLDKDEKFFSYYDLKYTLTVYEKNKISAYEKQKGLIKRLLKALSMIGIHTFVSRQE